MYDMVEFQSIIGVSEALYVERIVLFIPSAYIKNRTSVKREKKKREEKKKYLRCVKERTVEMGGCT